MHTQFAHHFAKGSWVVAIQPNPSLYARMIADLSNPQGFSYYVVGPILNGADGQFVGAIPNVFGSNLGMKITIEDATASELRSWLSIFIKMKFCPELRHEFFGQKDLHYFIRVIAEKFVELEGDQALNDWCFRADFQPQDKLRVAFVLAEMKEHYGSVDIDTVAELIKPVILDDQVKKLILELSEKPEAWDADQEW